MNNGSTRSTTLSVEQLKIVSSIVREIFQFQESRLLELGVSEADLELLDTQLRKIEALCEGKAADGDVRFTEVERSTDSSKLTAASTEASEVQGPTPIITVEVSSDIVTWWRPSSEFVLQALSPRELFLRTGYTYDELRDAVKALEFTH